MQKYYTSNRAVVVVYHTEVLIVFQKFSIIIMPQIDIKAEEHSNDKKFYFFLLMAFSFYSIIAYLLNALGFPAQFSIITIEELLVNQLKDGACLLFST